MGSPDTEAFQGVGPGGGTATLVIPAQSRVGVMLSDATDTDLLSPQ